jgi:hypothetical protein
VKATAITSDNISSLPGMPPDAPGIAQSVFQVPSLLHFLGGLVHRHRSFWLWLAGIESNLLHQEMARISIRKPIYICGLARSGSTLLHEVVAAHPSVATHRVKDYPMVFTPYWWRRALAKRPPQLPRQRLHQDGVMITPDSPDALEEILWMSFFPRCHDPSVSCLLGDEVRHPAFESFYTAHLRKLMLAERATRYAAKANYHVARLPYLARLFPDARFVIPVRSPESHIASLGRQHRWFSQGQRKHRRALAYMQRTGHFEFGLDRRPMHLGDVDQVRRVRAAWMSGDEIRGLAILWDMVYGYVARLLAANDHLRQAVLVVRFEDLCASPARVLRALFDHGALPGAEKLIETYAARISVPTYYQTDFSRQERAIIREETAATAGLWGY